jgi:uncharacterized protein with HEPN domain
MNEKVIKCLFDIKLAIDEIDSFFSSRTKRYDQYLEDIILKRAIERNLEIIGEAITRILKEDPEFPLNNAKKIIGLRNQIIHAYDAISDENIWGIVINHLPVLKLEVEALIQQSRF